MRRQFRILFSFASVLSCILCAATVVLWVRSYRVDDSIFKIAIESEPTGETRGERTRYFDSENGVFSYSMYYYSGSVLRSYIDFEYNAWEYRARPPTPYLIADDLRHPTWWNRAGFLYYRYVLRPHDEDADEEVQINYNASSVQILTLPHWLLTLLFLLAPCLMGARWFRGRRSKFRTLTGHCGKCGYDLRATSNRCPECGTDIEAKGKKGSTTENTKETEKQ